MKKSLTRYSTWKKSVGQENFLVRAEGPPKMTSWNINWKKYFFHRLPIGTKVFSRALNFIRFWPYTIRDQSTNTEFMKVLTCPDSQIGRLEHFKMFITQPFLSDFFFPKLNNSSKTNKFRSDIIVFIFPRNNYNKMRYNVLHVWCIYLPPNDWISFQ